MACLIARYKSKSNIGPNKLFHYSNKFNIKETDRYRTKSMDYSKWDNINDSIASEIADKIVSRGLDTIGSVYEKSKKASIV
jgi:hypothetical protein